MTKENYNGWNGRSTWLVQVYLDNTTPAIAEVARLAAIGANTSIEYKNRIRAILLLPEVKIREEVDYNETHVDWRELYEANAPTDKCKKCGRYIHKPHCI